MVRFAGRGDLQLSFSQLASLLPLTPSPGNKLCLVVLIWHQIQKPEAGALTSGLSVALSDMGACELRVLS